MQKSNNSLKVVQSSSERRLKFTHTDSLTCDQIQTIKTAYSTRNHFTVFLNLILQIFHDKCLNNLHLFFCPELIKSSFEVYEFQYESFSIWM